MFHGIERFPSPLLWLPPAPGQFECGTTCNCSHRVVISWGATMRCTSTASGALHLTKHIFFDWQPQGKPSTFGDYFPSSCCRAPQLLIQSIHKNPWLPLRPPRNRSLLVASLGLLTIINNSESGIIVQHLDSLLNNLFLLRVDGFHAFHYACGYTPDTLASQK